MPDTPTVVPWKVQDYSDNTSMLVRIQPLTELQKGGSEIISYQIQVDDGQAGDFTIVLGDNAEEDPNLISLETEIKLSNLLQSATYRARYRAINSIGKGGWSESAYLLVASPPNAPLKPILLSVDETQISITVLQSVND